MGGGAFQTIHASCVAIDGRGVLLVGPSGVGKSDVALRLIDAGAELVSDDQTMLRLDGETIIAGPPPAIAGLLEVRGVGLLRLNWAEASVRLYVELMEEGVEGERLPERTTYTLMGQKIRWIRLYGRAASTPAAIRAVLEGAFEDV